MSAANAEPIIADLDFLYNKVYSPTGQEVTDPFPDHKEDYITAMHEDIPSLVNEDFEALEAIDRYHEQSPPLKEYNPEYLREDDPAFCLAHVVEECGEAGVKGVEAC